MPNIVTNQIKIGNSKNFLDSLSTTDRSLYLMIGRPQPWENDRSPPDPIDSIRGNNQIWDESIALKRILPIDAKPVIRRVNWTENEIYDQYDHEDADLWEKKFYVLNSNFDVYKCISNNRRSRSTIEPTGQSLNIFKTRDGYKWKYIYSIDVANQLRFTTRNWMPVLRNPDVASVAKDGAIENIEIFNGGSDYSAVSFSSIKGDGKNAEIVAKQRIGVINDFQIIDPGEGYRYARLIIEDDTGQYANAKPIISPIGGHGFDPITEFGAYRIMLNARTEYNEGQGDIPPDIQFRRLCLVKDPLEIDETPAVSLTYNSMKILNFTNATRAFVNGEYIEGSNSKSNAYAVVANIQGTVGFIKYVKSIDSTNLQDFDNGETIVGKTSGAAALISSNVLPEVKHDSGSIIYVENRTPVSRYPDQAENLHLVIEF